MTDPNDYEVGYGKPHAQNRWKKGQSGNPRGRPQGVARAQGRSSCRADLAHGNSDEWQADKRDEAAAHAEDADSARRSR